MATNSDLLHVYGISGFDVVSTQYLAGQAHIHIQHAKRTLRCPRCFNAGVKKNGTGKRTLRLPPTGTKQAFVVAQVQRIICPACNFDGQLPMPFAQPRRTYTNAFARYVFELLKFGTPEHVAKHLGVGWDMVKDIHKEHLHKLYNKPSLKNVSTIAIDEFYAGRKTGYYTFVLDLSSGAIVHVGDGKGADALKPFWKRLRNHKEHISAVAMDMSGAFISAVRENLPGAAIVFDPFHVIKLMNDKLDEIRRELVRQALDTDRDFIKGTRWLLLKGAENLSLIPNPKKNDKTEAELLSEALAFNQPLATAYYLKEDLRRLWSFPDAISAGIFLDGWLEKAAATQLKPLMTMANTLRSHRVGILAYFEYRITSGPMEATNNKIRVLQRQTYGIRDRQYFKLNIKALHKKECRLTAKT